MPALPRSCCSFGQLACCRQSCTPVCLNKRGLVPVLLLVVAPGVRVIPVLAAAACAARCCYLPGIQSGHWPCCTCHLLEPLAVIAPVSALGLCLFLLLVCVCSCAGVCFPSGCCGFDPACSLPQLWQLLFRWVPRCSCHWGLYIRPTTSSNTVS